jgi:hypothetical protein
MRKKPPLSDHAWDMLAVIGQRTHDDGRYWVPRDREEFVHIPDSAPRTVFVYGLTTTGALRSLESRGYIAHPHGSTVVHRWAYAITESGRAALVAHGAPSKPQAEPCTTTRRVKR